MSNLIEYANEPYEIIEQKMIITEGKLKEYTYAVDSSGHIVGFPSDSKHYKPKYIPETERKNIKSKLKYA